MSADEADVMRLAATSYSAAVELRPHYPPCDFPDHACSCGAAEDRPRIADYIAALSARPLVSGTANRDDVARVIAHEDQVIEWSTTSSTDGYLRIADAVLALLGGDQDN